ncbi:MAG: hypothetical protein J6X49_08065 [Victivallales bacterium]|nr:hypothetical protein [Victivallales bacterium]
MKARHLSMKLMLMLMATTMIAVAQDMSFDGLLKDGVTSYKKGDYKAASEKFEDAGKLRPDDARVKYNEALSRYMNAEYDKAREGFQRALEKGFAEDDAFKARCELGIGNCHYRESVQKKDEAKDKPLQEQLEAVKEAKASCDQGIESYRDAIRHSQKLKNAKDNLKTARQHRKELVKNLRLLEEELKKQPQQQQQQNDQKQDGEKQDGQQQQQGDQKQEGQQQEGEQKEGEQQQGEQQQESAEQQLDELAKQQAQAAEKNEQGQQSQQQAADEQKDISDKTEQMRKAMEQQREEAEKQNGQSSEKSEAEKKLEKAQEAQKKAEDALEKGDMKSASEAQKEAAEKLDEAKKAMSEGEKKDQEEQQQPQQQPQEDQQDGSEEQMSEMENDIQNILDQERNNQRRKLKLLRIKPVEKDW